MVTRLCERTSARTNVFGLVLTTLLLNLNVDKQVLLKETTAELVLIGIIIAWSVFDVIYEPLHLMFVNLLYYPIAHYG